MGNSSSSTAASNYASVVNNSITNIVNDVAMSCESSVTLHNGVIFVTQIEGSQNVNLDINLEQTNNAAVSAECIQSSEIVSNASAAISNSVTQYAEAVQAGFIPPPSVSNTTTIVNNVSQSILNSYSSECASEFSQKNTAVFVTSIKKSNAINATFDVRQNNQVDYISTCITDVLLDTEATQEMTNIIDQTAKAESKSVIGALAVLLVLLIILMAAVYVFGKSFAQWIFDMFFSLFKGLLLMSVIVVIAIGLAILIMWVFGVGMFGTTRLQERITGYDGAWDFSRGVMTCDTNMFAAEEFPPEFKDRAGKEGKLLDGYTHCVDPGFGDSAKYSYWCKNDQQFFGNLGMDIGYFYPPED